ncbi:hypothetical protein IJG73_01915 [Candidatus Saccharibacteria bacterium]|nr:hypothetical protein [Candidatus Saccharibacteria bacterium]
MPTKKSTHKTTKLKAAGVARHKNRCKTVILACVLIAVICVTCVCGVVIYHTIKYYHETNARVSSFSLITEEDMYNTVAMNDDYLEIIASDWGAPAIERQLKIDLHNDKAEAVVHYGRTREACDEPSQDDTNCIVDEVYYGTLDHSTVEQFVTSVKAILADETKRTFTLSQYAENEALVEICQTAINYLKEH